MQQTQSTSRKTLRRLHHVRAGLLAVAATFCAWSAAAALTRTPRTHRPLPVQQPQSSRHAKSSHAKSGSKARQRSSLSSAHHAAPLARRRRHPAADDAPDPPTMERIRHHPLHQPAAPARRLTPAQLRRAAAARQSAELAARIEADVEAQARTQSQHPRPYASSAEASLQPPAPIVRTPAAHRVDGFGAEGANLPAPAPLEPRDPIEAAPVPLTAEADLEALAHPTTSQLAAEAVQPRLYSSSGRLILPAPLKGSHDVLIHQNLMADDEGLSRIQDDDELDRLRDAHLLVELPVSASLQINPALPANRRCARPWTVRFAADIAAAFYARFHQPLQINSAVRTVDVQLRLERTNGNAAPAEGETASPHLTGQAIDFAKHGMSLAQIAWMRAYLLPLMNSGQLDVEEEFQQACFHISVYRSYLPARHRSAPRTLVAQLPTR